MKHVEIEGKGKGVRRKKAWNGTISEDLNL